MARANPGVLAGELSGKAGTVVFVQTARGVVIRPRVVPRNPQIPAQTGVRHNLSRAVAAYRALTPAQAAQWQTYAHALPAVNPHTPHAPRPTAYAAFVRLAAKFLQITPAGTLPATPPALPFFGDVIALGATGGTGAVTFTAAAGNAAHVRTELLWQRLKFGHQAIQTDRYRTQAFVTFAAGTLSATLPATSGWYAPAYRFVNAQTGQATDLVPLPVVQVG